jgi:protein-tyrosine phosphatase
VRPRAAAGGVGEPLAPLARLLAADRPAFGEALRELLERAETERVEIACGGGIGRTGTALACLAVLDGVPNDEAIT